MALIKRSKVIDKGFVDLRQADYKAAPVLSSNTALKEPSMEVQEIVSELQEGSDPDAMVEGAYEKASQIVSQAQLEAQEFMENAQTEIESIRERAKEEGLEEGKAEGQQQISELINQALETLNDAIKQRKKIIKDSEGELVRLSLKIAEQIIRSEVSLHKDVVLNIVTEAINKISDRESVIVKVNRDDVEHIKKYKDRIAGIVDGVKNLSILEDSQVDPGGCVVETNLGYVDARISTKISLIEQALGKAQDSGSD